MGKGRLGIPPRDEIFLEDLRFGKDLDNTAGGDADRVNSLENLRQAVLHRLITVPGSLPLHPGYGIGIQQYRGDVSRPSTQERILRAIQEQFLDDPRIDAVESLRITPNTSNPSLFTVRLKIRAVGRSQIDLEVDIGE